MKRAGLLCCALAVAGMMAMPAHGAEYLSPDTVPLTAKEKRVLDLVRQWSGAGKDGARSSFMQGGQLVYVHGADGGIPVVIAAPLQVVDVELEPGEMVNEIVVGDSARWQVESGSAGASTHLFIKPIDVGLESSAVVTTDRRVYHLRLVSRKAKAGSRLRLAPAVPIGPRRFRASCARRSWIRCRRRCRCC